MAVNVDWRSIVVIPAKAGIHFAVAAAVAVLRLIGPKHIKGKWILAFAKMTPEGVERRAAASVRCHGMLPRRSPHETIKDPT